MRCAICNYPLWSLKARECPECGESFRPSESEFVPNSVRFCCPHCDQSYYGTGATGHLVPRSFDCVQCGALVDMDEMVMRPAAGVAEEQTQIDVHPWTSRHGRGWLMPWLRTVGMAMVAPVRLARVMPAHSTPGKTFGFAIATVSIILLCGAAGPLAAIGAAVFLFGGTNPTGLLIAAFVVLVIGVVLFLVVVVLWGLVTHSVLLLTGDTPYPIGRTYQAICYSAGANVTSSIPIIGIYPFIFVGLCWWLVSAILMIGEAQKASGARTALAALVFPALLFVLAGFGIGGLTVFGMNQANAAVAMAQALRTEAECTLIVNGLTTFRTENARWPAHAVELIDGAAITPLDLVVTDTLTYHSDVPIGDTNLKALFSLSAGERKDPIAATIAAQPADLVAHRCGDFVFTYHGVDADAMDPGLWLVMVSPDPAINEDPDVNGVITVGKADGTVASIAFSDFQRRLERQNEFRARAGLAALSMPATVTHEEPLVESRD